MKVAILVLALVSVSMGFVFPDIHSSKPVVSEFQPAVGFMMPNQGLGMSPRIVGGSEAPAHAYPHQISLQRSSGGSWYHSCGGSLVGNTKIITAAHCVSGASVGTMRVVLGDHNLNTVEGTEQTHTVRSATAHPSYNGNTIDYDYAVIHLTNAVTFTDNIKIIELVDSEPTSGNVINSGWGNIKGDGTVTNPPILQHVTLPIVSRSSCVSAFNGINTVTARMLCAGASGKGPCNGDSGGPLVYNGKLAGIVSWGMQPCAQARYPGVYSNVATGRQWLDAQ